MIHITEKYPRLISQIVFKVYLSLVFSFNNEVLIFTDVIEHSETHFQKSVAYGSLFWNSLTSAHWVPTIGKRHSHSACTYENSMYVFGGCTATCTTFNDLWRLDLDTRKWVRPITMGSYPSPKACATMLRYKKNFILFGGWSHPSPYPVHQVFRIII